MLSDAVKIDTSCNNDCHWNLSIARKACINTTNFTINAVWRLLFAIVIKKVWGRGFRCSGVRRWKKIFYDAQTLNWMHCLLSKRRHMSGASNVKSMHNRLCRGTTYTLIQCSFLHFVIINILRSARFWDFTQRRMVIPYRRFGTTYRYRTAILCCVKFQKSAGCILCTAMETWNHEKKKNIYYIYIYI